MHEYGIGGMRLGKGNQSTRGKSFLFPRCSLSISHDAACDQTLVTAVGIRRLAALTMALLLKNNKVTKEEVKLILKCLLMQFRNFYIEVEFRFKQTRVNEVHGREDDILSSMKQVQIKLRKI
jgi:hypothetical protein